MTEKSDPVEVVARGIDPEAFEEHERRTDLATKHAWRGRMDSARHRARSALAAAEAAGMVMVPKVSNYEMERAGANCFGGQGDSADARYEVSVMYRAMIEAASLAQQEKP